MVSQQTLTIHVRPTNLFEDNRLAASQPSINRFVIDIKGAHYTSTYRHYSYGYVYSCMIVYYQQCCFCVDIAQRQYNAYVLVDSLSSAVHCEKRLILLLFTFYLYYCSPYFSCTLNILTLTRRVVCVREPVVEKRSPHRSGAHTTYCKLAPFFGL